ncbi:MAG: hypothetical protein ACTSRE_00900 [Promethearchaeota archaeon]
MRNPKFSVQRVVGLWKTMSQTRKNSPKEIAIKISQIVGYNPISVTLLAQQSSNDSIRSEAIQAYYYLMEEEMVRKSIELSIMG